MPKRLILNNYKYWRNSSGDIVLLANSGHGIVTLEESEIIEVKQGPYLEADDKVRFEAVAEDKIIIKGEQSG